MTETEEKKYVLTLDVGTTGVKQRVYDSELQVLASGEHPLSTREEGDQQTQWAEDWWDGVRKLCRGLAERDLDRSQIAAICCTGQMQDCLLLDGEGEPLTEVLLYSDGRARQQYESLVDRLGQERLNEMTGNNYDPLWTLNKYLWLRDHAPGAFSEHRYLVFGSKDYLVYQMTGNHLTDYTNGSTTGFMDLLEGDWNRELLEELDLDVQKLPDLRPATELAGRLGDEAAEQLRLPADVPVVNGSGDMGASTLGAGAVGEGQVYCYLGTTGWLAQPSGEPSPNRNIYTLRSIDGQSYILTGAVLNAGKTYDWALRRLFDDVTESGGEEHIPPESYKRHEKRIEEVPRGSRGVVFLPFLTGERSPMKIRENSGGFLGVGPEVDRHTMLRAVLEGVAYSLRHNLEEMTGGENALERINLVGGGSKSSIWPRILSDVLNVKVQVLDLSGGAPTVGAALMAFRYLGWVEEDSYPDRLLRVSRVFDPEPESVEIYEAGYQEYRRYVDALF